MIEGGKVTLKEMKAPVRSLHFFNRAVSYATAFNRRFFFFFFFYLLSFCFIVIVVVCWGFCLLFLFYFFL